MEIVELNTDFIAHAIFNVNPQTADLLRETALSFWNKDEKVKAVKVIKLATDCSLRIALAFCKAVAEEEELELKKRNTK